MWDKKSEHTSEMLATMSQLFPMLHFFSMTQQIGIVIFIYVISHNGVQRLLAWIIFMNTIL